MARFFIPNPGFKAKLAATPDYQRAMRSTADEVARHVGALAGNPWMPAQGRSHIEVVQTREGVSVVNTDHGAHLKEWGSSRNPPSAPMRRGVRAAGLRLRETPKP
jgi:hypothetical protein